MLPNNDHPIALDLVVLNVRVRSTLPLLPSVGTESLLEPLERDTSRHTLVDAGFSSQIRSLLLLDDGLGGPGPRSSGGTEYAVGTGQLVASLAYESLSSRDGGKGTGSGDGGGDDGGCVGGGGRGLSTDGLLDSDSEGVGLSVPLGSDARGGEGCEIISDMSTGTLSRLPTH